jgi:hypothetical protein
MEKIVDYQDEERVVHLVVRSATARMGIMRSLLMERAIDEESKKPPIDLKDLDAIGTRFLRTVLYPSLIAATVEATGFSSWPISFDEFLTLPEQLAIQWEEAAVGLNPHWRTTKMPETELEEAQKKVINSLPGS